MKKKDGFNFITANEKVQAFPQFYIIRYQDDISIKLLNL